jgi:hypothetical protein
MSEYIINGKKFDDEKSEKLYSGGDGQSLDPKGGALQVYRSPKGTVWARHYHWVSEVRASETLVSGESAVRSLILRGATHGRAVTITEKVFGEVEEG